MFTGGNRGGSERNIIFVNSRHQSWFGDVSWCQEEVEVEYEVGFGSKEIERQYNSSFVEMFLFLFLVVGVNKRCGDILIGQGGWGCWLTQGKKYYL